MKKSYKILIQSFLFMLPWNIRKRLLKFFFKFEIDKDATIGFSYILARNVKMESKAFIGNFNFINEIDSFKMAPFSKIGRKNWITGSSAVLKKGYSASPNRTCHFEIGVHTRITDGHHFDCNGGIYIGKFTTVAGTNSQILSHSVDIYENRQKAGPVNIGDYCFIGTKCILLMGANLPSYSVLGAGAVLNKYYNDEFRIYAGTPAKPLKEIPMNAKYFNRSHGNVT